MLSRAATILCVFLTCCVGPAAAQPFTRPDLTATRADRAPVIDGVLTESEWPGEPLTTGDWLSYNPLHGDQIPQRTTVWLAFDDRYLYFAFRCDDPEPSQIKTSVTRRDNIFQDDWVGLSLDALGTGQMSYHMMVNPNGVQLDMLNSVAGNEDPSPDWIWDSAGKLTDSGYVVELRLPLQSIRFKGGADTRMGLLLWRRVSRSGISVAWPPLAPNAWVFERHANVRFDRLDPRRVREILPSATYARTTLLDAPDSWGEADGRGEVGFSTKLGVTSTITLDATVNPDFSQVESDAFQVEVNQRFPVFFGEKRPFFMEGAGIFSLAGAGGPNSLTTAVHTRRIVDPVFGAKLTGSVGRVSFGTLTAVDESAKRLVPEDSPQAGSNRYFNIARAQYSLGTSNYVGALYTDTTFAGEYNRVAGVDARWRVNETQRLDAFALLSNTRAEPDGDATSGAGAQVQYSYSTRTWNVAGAAEHYDEDFQMDTAFLRRTGVSLGTNFVERSFYPDKDHFSWLPRVALATFTRFGTDRNAGGREFGTVPGVRFFLTRQGFVLVEHSFGYEHWAGRRFENGRFFTFGNMQVFRWLNVDARYSRGNAVFYDAVNPYQGHSVESGGGVTLQPNGRFSQSIGYDRIAFDRAADDTTIDVPPGTPPPGERVFTVNIVNSRTTYQFTRAFALRGIAQYDSSRSRVLTDFLASYEPRPGTVVYAGYGSLIEQRSYVDGQWRPGEGVYRTTQRGLFFKASYLYRF